MVRGKARQRQRSLLGCALQLNAVAAAAWCWPRALPLVSGAQPSGVRQAAAASPPHAPRARPRLQSVELVSSFPPRPRSLRTCSCSSSSPSLSDSRRSAHPHIRASSPSRASASLAARPLAGRLARAAAPQRRLLLSLCPAPHRTLCGPRFCPSASCANLGISAAASCACSALLLELSSNVSAELDVAQAMPAHRRTRNTDAGETDASGAGTGEARRRKECMVRSSSVAVCAAPRPLPSAARRAWMAAVGRRGARADSYLGARMRGGSVRR
jgi:hypothetical protein